MKNNKWISVKDRLPIPVLKSPDCLESEVCLVCSKDKEILIAIMIVENNGKPKWFTTCDEMFEITEEVKYWLPIPDTENLEA